MDARKPLFIDLNGRIACSSHLGAEASAMLQKKPSRFNIRTSLTHWQRLPTDYDFACEQCRYSKH